MKYIVYEGVAPYSGGMEKKEFAIVFGEDQTHSIIARGLHDPTGRRQAKIVSAGFFFINDLGVLRTEGISESLKGKGEAFESRPDDWVIIQECYPTFDRSDV